MTKASNDLQDLRRRIYVKAKAETTWRFWGLYVHVCKMETLRAAYALAKKNDGAPGVDGVTFAAIETQGVDAFLEQMRTNSIAHICTAPSPKAGNTERRGQSPRAFDSCNSGSRGARGAQAHTGADLRGDFQPGSFGYRPKRTAHEAVDRVARAIVQEKTRIIDIDLRSYFDNVRHDRLLAKVARRVDDADVLHLLKLMLKANGQRGVPQGGVISPLLSNLYLNEVGKMLERAKETTQSRQVHQHRVRTICRRSILIDAQPRHDWLIAAVERRLREELAKLQVQINEEKSRNVDLSQGESFGFLGFDFRRVRSFRGSGVPTTRQSSRIERHCCGSSKTCSAATGRNQ